MRFGRIFDTVDSWGLTILRLALGSIFFAHGSQKLLGWFGGGGLEATIQNFQQGLVIPMPLTLLAVAAEFLGGLGVIVGLLTRVAALGLAGVMAVAIAKVHWVHGFFMNWYCTEGAGHGIEFNVALLAMALALLVSGAGNGSVDKLLSRR